MHGDNHDGQRALDMTIGNWHILRAVWYPYFKPNPMVAKSFTVSAWKVATTSSGEKPGHPVFLKEIGGDKVFHASYKDLGKKFLPEQHYKDVLAFNGYIVEDQGDDFISFARKPAI